MKIKQTTLASLACVALMATAGAAPVVLNFTGATAFRAAANNTFKSVLTGCTYAYVTTSDFAGSNRSIFKGTYDGTEYIIRCSWSGSTAGVAAIENGTPVQLLDVSTPTSADPGTLITTPTYVTDVAMWSFSDVAKGLSTVPNAVLGGGPVGVIPFAFAAGESAPAGVTNMTDQLHNLTWSDGTAPASLYSGNPADAGFTLFATGRNSGSGTRATQLAETQYGVFKVIQQYLSSISGDQTGSLTGSPSLAPDPAPGTGINGNGGYSSNSNVRDRLNRTSNSAYLGGQYAFVGLLTISDWNAATATEGAKPMTYNGVAYTEDNVKNGKYSMWGYQQLYTKNLPTSPTDPAKKFDTLLRSSTGIDANMGSAGIKLGDMAVERLNKADGAPILPL